MISKSFANAINAAIFGGVPLDIDTWYLGFTTEHIDDDGTIPAYSEPTITGYSRFAMKNNSDYFNTPKYSSAHPLSVVTNKKAVSFLIGSNAETEITDWFLSRNKTGNTADVWGQLEESATLGADSQFAIPAGSLILSINDKDVGDST